MSKFVYQYSLLLRDNDNKNAQFKTAQQRLNRDMMTNDSKFLQSQPNCFGFNISSKKTCVWRCENCCQFVESKTLDSAIASFLYVLAL